jgi:hypothetical protein
MATNINSTILVPMDLSQGASAINYTPSINICPILSVTCIGVTGSGVLKITPFRAADVILTADTGSGARLRLACDAIGQITTIEIAAGGTGYPDGAVTAIIDDPYGTGGILSCTASGGSITAASIVSPGLNYSGYINFELEDFINGVTYDFVPKYIEQVSGTGTLSLIGNRLSTRPFQIF